MTASTLPATKRGLGLIALAVLGAVSSSGAMAQSMYELNGPYIGGNIGATRSDFNNDSVRSGLASRGFGITSTSEDNSSTGGKLFGGYQFNRNFAIEGGYFDLGRFGYTSNTTPAGSLSGSSRIRGLNLDLVGTLPVTDRFSVIGRIGAAYARARDNVSTTGLVPANIFPTSKNDTYAKVGLGVQYAITEALSLRGELERYRVDDPVRRRGYVDMASVGLVYRFGAKTPTPVAYVPVASPPPPPPPAPVYVAPPPPVVIAPAPAPLPAYEPPARPARQGRN